MRQHLDLVQPNFGLLSSIGPEHLEKLIDLDTVENEEGILFESLLENGGLAAVNHDDERIKNQADLRRGLRKITYGISARADVHGALDPHSGSLLVEGISQTPEDFSCPLEGIHNALNLLGAIALAHGMGLSASEIRRGLGSFTPPPGRSEVHEWQGARVYADTYNANPASVTAALKTIHSASSGRALVCLGDMLELGRLEEFYHRSLARPILDAHADFVFLFGPRMKSLEDELHRIGFAGRIEHFSNKESMAAEIRRQAKSGDVLLLKGSRGMRMEEVWEALKRGI
jgi:UDP-N-acetylmuramoyl-tripeptide--D-alanyl-D-alanine ligase